MVIYASQPGGDWLSVWTGHAQAAVASISRLEALGFTGISTTEESAIQLFLQNLPAYPLDDEVIERAVKLRQLRRMKLGDAIIAATALVYGLSLVTRNLQDFQHVAGLTLINPFDPAITPGS